MSPRPKMQTTVPTPNPANPKHCGEVEFPVLLPEHDGYPIRPGRLTPATTPFVETRRIPKPRIATPTINDSRRTPRSTFFPHIDLPKGEESTAGPSHRILPASARAPAGWSSSAFEPMN